MPDEKAPRDFYKIGFFILLVVVILTAAFLISFVLQQSASQKNKEIATQILHQAVETGIIDPLADTYFDPNIQLEYPPAFHLPPNHVNTVTGIDNIKAIARTWKADTMHQVEIVDAISDGDTVSVLLSQDRIFQMGNETVTYRNHPAIYYFTFKNGKIVKILGVFDVLNDVEAFKDTKYVVNQTGSS
jgi:predicted SnoaL-like aldol condensation-catalyzing enzyme